MSGEPPSTVASHLRVMEEAVEADTEKVGGAGGTPLLRLTKEKKYF